MKKLFILLFASLPLCLFAQVKENLVTPDLSGINAFSEQLFSGQVKDSTTRHSFIKQYSTGSVAFSKGQGYYQFNQIIGHYTELFPIWKKYFDPTATEGSATATVQKITTPRGTMVMSFARYGDLWAIRGKIY